MGNVSEKKSPMSMEMQKPFLDVFKSERKQWQSKPRHVPFWFMRQAGRYLPEYRELRASKNGFLDMAFDPKSAIEITMQPLRRFNMDAAIIFSDILVIPFALGQNLDFIPGEGPKLDATQNASSLDASDIHRSLMPVYDAISGTREALEKEGFDQTALIGFAGAPWTVACYMIQGHGGCDFEKAQNLLRESPKEFFAILDMVTHATSDYLIAQAKAGAEALKIFDSWSGLLSVKDQAGSQSSEFFSCCVAPTKKIIDRVRASGVDVPIIGFPRLAQKEDYILYAQTTKLDAIAIDQGVDLIWARETLQKICPVQGNLDPILLKLGQDEEGLSLEEQTQKILEHLGQGPFIFNLGHGIDKETPIENVEKVIKVIKDYGSE